MSKHTPGPWEYRLTEGSDKKLATVYGRGKGIARHVLPEDARLIAAAPDLLEACKTALYGGGTIAEAAEKCRAAIAKAEGRE